jgi:hypothetical protein
MPDEDLLRLQEALRHRLKHLSKKGRVTRASTRGDYSTWVLAVLSRNTGPSDSPPQALPTASGRNPACRALPALDAGRLTRLMTAVSAVEEALLLCGSSIDLSVLKPLPFRPPEPLPNAALTRALLAALRLSPNALSADALAQAIVTRQQLHDAERRRLLFRVCRAACGLAKRGVLQESNSAWAIQA